MGTLFFQLSPLLAAADSSKSVFSFPLSPSAAARLLFSRIVFNLLYTLSLGNITNAHDFSYNGYADGYLMCPPIAGLGFRRPGP